MHPMRRPAWQPGPGAHWESWSLNGEVVITGLVPPQSGVARLASCLTWLLRTFASRCRRTHDGTGALAFACTGSRGPSTLAWAMSLWFDLALQEPRLIRERVRRRGGDPTACRWPTFWLEGDVYDYITGGQRIPHGRTPHRTLVVLAEEQQVFVPARTVALTASVRRVWGSGIDAVARVDIAGDAVSRLLDQDEHAFLVNMLALVHARPATHVRPRPPLEESYRRHESLVAELAPPAEAKGLPVTWHALWRLPPAMTWSAPGGESWIRYPAISFAAAARRLRSAG